MKPTLVVLCFLSFLAFSFNAHSAVGTVVKLRGKAIRVPKGTKNKVPLAMNSALEVGDTIVTSKKSFLRVKMNDDTFFNLGPSSQLRISKFTFTKVKRETLYSVARGQVRAIINKKAENDKAVVIKTKNVSLGVRGTEFLTNAYMVKGKATSDVVLLKGKVATNVSKLNIPQKSFNLKPGQAFNTNKLVADKSLASVKQVSPDVLASLTKNVDSFLPNMQLPNGSFVDLSKAITAAAGVGAAVGALAGVIGALIPDGGGDKKATDAAAKAQSQATPTATPKPISKIEENTINPNDPWDIRDAHERRDDVMAEGNCFFWFYKKLPGGGVPQRRLRSQRRSPPPSRRKPDSARQATGFRFP